MSRQSRAALNTRSTSTRMRASIRADAVPLSSETKKRNVICRRRPYHARRAGIHSNGQKSTLPDASSTESTARSRLIEADNVMILKKEISEWRRREALRNRIDQALGPGASAPDISADTQDSRINFGNMSKLSSTECVENRRVLETVDNYENMESAKRVKLKNGKQGKENVPDVTWIHVQPEKSTSTSLKSVADYLSEMPEEVFLPKRTLCLSPATLNVLKTAEKLVEDSEKQISQINCDASYVDDLEENKISDENIYIRNVVASMIEKGYYDPVPALNKVCQKSKFIISERSILKPSNKTHENPCILKDLPKSPSENIQLKSTDEECLFCKFEINEQSKEIHKEIEVLESQNVDFNSVEKNINKDKPEKLNVQKGPIISIKADFSVQTSQIVDIQPDTASRQFNKKGSENVGTFEFQYLTSKNNSFEQNSDVTEIIEKPSPNVMQKISTTARKSTGTILKDTRQCNYKDAIGMTEYERERENIFWEEYAALSLDESLSDLSLQEPVILTKMDSFLEHQWKLIQKVQGATENFNQFLMNRLPNETFLISDKNKKTSEDYTKNEMKASDTIAEKDEQRVVSRRKLIELSHEIDVLTKNKSFQINYKPNSSKSEESNKSKDFMSINEKDLTVSKDFFSDPSNTSHSDFSQKVAKRVENQKQDMMPLRSEVSTTLSKNISYTKNFESKAIDESESSKIMKNISFAQTSTDMGTKCNSGVENMKSVEISDNNLDANPYQQNKSNVGDISYSSTKLTSDKKLSKESKNTREDANTPKSSILELEKILTEKALECQNQTNNEFETNKVTSIAERKKDIRTLSDDSGENSLKTSHLIESISDISSNKTNYHIKSQQDSLRLSTISNDRCNTTLGTDSIVLDKSNNDQLTESKIEKQIFELRENLDNLKNVLDNDDKSLHQVQDIAGKKKDEIQQRYVKIPALLENKIDENISERNVRMEQGITESTATMSQKYNTSDSKFMVSILKENRSSMTSSLQQQKIGILKKLESCAISSQRKERRLFTSTVLGDIELPNNTSSLVKFKGLSESSSDTHSEGEIRLSSSTSYSAGEVRIKSLINKSSSSIKLSSETSTSGY